MPVFAASPRIVRNTEFADVTAAVLCERLRDVKRRDFTSALWVGAGDASQLQSIKAIENLQIRAHPVEGAIEEFPYAPESLDLIIVNGTLNVVNDLPGALIQMRRALKADGLFLCALPGGETLHELRDVLARVETQLHGGAHARIHPVVDLQSMAALMQRAGFTLPVVDGELKTIYYRRLNTLLHDIKHAGEGLALTERPRNFVGKKFWAAVEDAYRNIHADTDGLLKASIEIFYAIGWGPADTQQQPLKPGSARHRLAEALGSRETALPERAKPH